MVHLLCKGFGPVGTTRLSAPVILLLPICFGIGLQWLRDFPEWQSLTEGLNKPEAALWSLSFISAWKNADCLAADAKHIKLESIIRIITTNTLTTAARFIILFNFSGLLLSIIVPAISPIIGLKNISYTVLCYIRKPNKRRNRSEYKTNSSTEIPDSQNLRGECSKLYRKLNSLEIKQFHESRDREMDGGEMKQSKDGLQPIFKIRRNPKIKTLLHRYVKLMNVVNAKGKDQSTAFKAHGASCSSIKSFTTASSQPLLWN